MSLASKYAKPVEWSEEDTFFAVNSPRLLHGGCH